MISQGHPFKNKDLSKHRRGLQILVIKIYKVMSNVISVIVNSLFDFCKYRYNIKNFARTLDNFTRCEAHKSSLCYNL